MKTGEHAASDIRLEDAGISITPTHLIVGGYRYGLSAVAAYGPERFTQRYRVPAIAALAGLGTLIFSVNHLDGLASGPGTVTIGVGIMILIDSVLWMVARRSPALQLESHTGHRWRVALGGPDLLPAVLEALDAAIGGAARR